VNRKFMSIATSVALIAGTVAPSFAADLTPQPVSQVNVTQLADGFRSSKLVGAPVVNDANQSIGKIDDLLVGRSDKVLYAVLSVGGFLGVGSKLVAVPYASLQIGPKDVVLPGGNKDQLKALPEFKYATS
jgi:PRC-barrel domain